MTNYVTNLRMSENTRLNDCADDVCVNQISWTETKPIISKMCTCIRDDICASSIIPRIVHSKHQDIRMQEEHM